MFKDLAQLQLGFVVSTPLSRAYTTFVVILYRAPISGRGDAKQRFIFGSAKILSDKGKQGSDGILFATKLPARDENQRIFPKLGQKSRNTS